MPDAPMTPAELALEQSGLGFLRMGKFRKARDAFKTLKKSQPVRALPLLIEANLGLAREMMAKGQTSEAAQVLAYLKTIAPASYDITVPDVREKCGPGDNWSAMVPLAARQLANSAREGAGIRAADEMILGATSPDHPGHPDAEAILTALEIGYASANTARVSALLRGVPRSSPFSHWVFFIKGMTALEAGQRGRAAEFFRRIPQESLLQSSMPALLAICGFVETQPEPRTVRALCAWISRPDLADPLLQAEPLWRRGRRSQAFTLLVKKIPGLMRWGARDLHADLTRFLTSAAIDSRDYDSDYFNTLTDYVSAPSRSELHALLDQAFFAIEFRDFPSCAHSHFQTVLGNLKRIQAMVPLAPAMRARIFTNLAEIYLEALRKDPDDACLPPNAKKALEHSIQEDPAYLRAWLMLCDLMAMGRDLSAYHRFVDDLAKRFPEEKEALIRNGDCCLGRKSHTKALRNFESAGKIDAVDPRIRRGILLARIGMAEDAYKKHMPSKADWEAVESLATPGMICADSSLWRLRVRRMALETREKGKDDGLTALLADTLPHAPNAFRLHCAYRFALVRNRKFVMEDRFGKLFPTRPAPESLADFIAVLDEAAAFEDSPNRKEAEGLARLLFAAHEPLLLGFVDRREDFIALLNKVFSIPSPDLSPVSPVIRKWHQRDPEDPVMRYLCSAYRFPWRNAPPLQEADDALEELRDSHDPEIRRLLVLFENHRRQARTVKFGKDRNQKSPKLDLDYDPHDAPDDPDDFDEFDDEDLSSIDEILGKIPPSKLIEALGAIMGGALAPPDIQPSTYNPPPPKPPRVKKPKPSGPDPNQLTFDDQFLPPSSPPQT